jgi:hypothetical protein
VRARRDDPIVREAAASALLLLAALGLALLGIAGQLAMTR